MSRTAGVQRGTATVATASRSTDRPTERVAEETPERLLDLLGDEYTRTVLAAIQDAPKSGAEVADVTGISKPTAFRRLNELVEVGIAETRQSVDTDGGHHCKEYRLVVDSLSIAVCTDGLAVSVDEPPADDSPRDRERPPRIAAND